MADNELLTTTELEDKFSRAANHLQSMIANLDSGQLLGFYGLYKQATCGICDTPKPSWYQTQAKYKWEAWKTLADMSKEVAMEKYINAITKIDPNWEHDAKFNAHSWIAISSLPNTDIELSDADKTFLDWVKEGNEIKLSEILSINQIDINVPGEDGMTAIHWAADRGYVPIIKCLVENGADINAQDDSGQTPLHYAASCSHKEAVEYLLSVAAKSLKDNDGYTPKDIADQSIQAML